MKTRTGIILLVIAAEIFMSACKKDVPGDAQAEKPVFNFTVQSVLGDVKIITASGEKKAAVGDLIAINDTITTGKKSIADLTYGSSGIIRISENSMVSIAVIAGDTSSESMINLDRGKVFLTLGKLQNTGFKVKTPTVVASVRGTSFVVSADVVRGARLSVMKGTVTVTPVNKGEAIAGKEISVGAGQKMDYVSRNTVEQILTGSGEIAVKPMTEAEIIEIKNETVDIRVDEIKGLDQDIKTEVKQDVIQVNPQILRKQASDAFGGQITRSPVKVQNDSRLKEQVDGQRLAEEKRKQEEELLKKAEEEKENQRIRARKEKASSIPTL